LLRARYQSALASFATFYIGPPCPAHPRFISKRGHEPQ
jgi:hypothetical protein